MNEALVNSNSPTCTSTRGHSMARFTEPQIWRPQTTTAVDLKSAVDTVAALFLVPPEYGAIEILKFGFHHSAAGGAVTTAGSLKLTIGGVDVENNAGDVIELPIAGASAAIYSPREQHLNRTLQINDPNNLSQEPDYPYALANEAIQLRVGTQGVGAGAQSVLPYIIFRVHPKNGTLYSGTWLEADGTSAP